MKLRFFAGLTMPEAAAALGISLATAERYWTFARSWLYAEMCGPSCTTASHKLLIISLRGSAGRMSHC